MSTMATIEAGQVVLVPASQAQLIGPSSSGDAHDGFGRLEKHALPEPAGRGNDDLRRRVHLRHLRRSHAGVPFAGERKRRAISTLVGLSTRRQPSVVFGGCRAHVGSLLALEACDVQRGYGARCHGRARAAACGACVECYLGYLRILENGIQPRCGPSTKPILIRLRLISFRHQTRPSCYF